MTRHISGPDWETVGCQSSPGVWQGPSDSFFEGTRKRRYDFERGVVRCIVLFDDQGNVITVRKFDQKRNVVSTHFYRADGTPDPNGVWGP